MHRRRNDSRPTAREVRGPAELSAGRTGVIWISARRRETPTAERSALHVRTLRDRSNPQERGYFDAALHDDEIARSGSPREKRRRSLTPAFDQPPTAIAS